MRRLTVVLCLMAAMLAPLALRAAARAAPKPGLSPPLAMARLKEAEAKVTSGTMRLIGTSRSTRWDGEVAEAEARAELAKNGRDYGGSTGTLRFTAAGWREDGTFTSPAGVSTLTMVGGAGGLRRAVVSAASHAHATVGPETPGPASLLNTLLRSGLAELLRQVPWKSSESTAAGLLLLKGDWQARSLALTLDPKVDYRPVEIRLVTTRTGEAGAATAAIQVTRVSYGSFAGIRVPAHVEQLNVTRLGEGAHASLLDLKVEVIALNAPVAGEALAVALPKGAEVLDARVGTPVRYQQGDRDLTNAEVRELAEKRLAEEMPAPPGGPKLGAPAPAIALKTLEGKEAKLADYRGKVVLLNWFASW
jgi:hypothetical protein